MKLTPQKILIGIIPFVLLLKSVSWPAETIEGLILKGSYREAIQNYSASKTLTPTENYFLGICYQESGEARKAENIWQTLLSGPENERSLLALAYLKSKNGSLIESEKFFRQFSKDFPNSPYQPAALFGLAETLFRKNKNHEPQESLTIMNRLRRRYPFSSEAEKATQFLNRESGPYTIQIGSFVDLSRAEKVAEELNSKGYEAYLTRALDLSVSYPVRVGNFKDKKKADNAGQILKKNTGTEYFITK
ncbi:MAG: SPOR domain-containing protein [Candidatus Omnitrophica bacterium]|nr:SPOR domain-containing protein [Candidatus Omnitrophota bacterium]